MTGPRRLAVTQPAPVPPGPGWLGLAWRYEEGEGHRACPEFIGYQTDRPGTVLARIKILTLPANASVADLQVGAALWTDYDEGAADLMAAAIEQENDMADKAKASPTVDLLGALQESVDRARASRIANALTGRPITEAELSPLEHPAPDTASLVEAIRVALSKGGYQMVTDMLPYETQARTIAAAVQPILAEAIAGRVAAAESKRAAQSMTDLWLRDQHARYHDQPGNLMGRSECGEMVCDFWDAAVHVREALAGADPA